MNTPPRRRRSDRENDPPLATPAAANAGAEAETARWLQRCAARVRAIEPALSQDEAADIARSMHDFERTRTMAPEAAADFVAAEMRRAGHTRFERRGAR